MTLTPAQRRLSARIAGLTSAATRDMREVGRRGLEAQLERYREQADPERKLPEAERNARALQLRRADMVRRSLKSSKTRAKNRKNEKRNVAVATTGAIPE
jgi:hypothetical protein